MSDEDLDARVRAVERALTDGDAMPDLSEAADAASRLDELEAEVAALAERVDALDATVQSLHGYVGDLEHVNERVERRADAARAAVERLEGERTPPTDGRQSERVAERSEQSTGRERTQSGPERTGLDDEGESLVDRVRDAL